MRVTGQSIKEKEYLEKIRMKNNSKPRLPRGYKESSLKLDEQWRDENMDFIEVYNTLETNIENRIVISTKKSDAISYKNDAEESLTININEDEYDSLEQICLVNNDTGVDLYINDNTGSKLHKYGLSEIVSFSIS